MEVQNFIKEMKEINSKLLVYLDKQESSEADYQLIIQLLNDLKIRENKHKLRDVVHIMAEIYSNHHGKQAFYSKLERIFLFLKNDIKQTFSNEDLYNMVKESNRLLRWFIRMI